MQEEEKGKKKEAKKKDKKEKKKDEKKGKKSKSKKDVSLSRACLLPFAVLNCVLCSPCSPKSGQIEMVLAVQALGVKSTLGCVFGFTLTCAAAAGQPVVVQVDVRVRCLLSPVRSERRSVAN